jgi:HEAT repeat protein
MSDPPPISSEPSAVRWEPRGERGGGVQSSGSGLGGAPEGIEQLSESDLVRLLGSVRPALVSAAEQQLMQRGWSGRLVRIAGTLASGETEAKLLALDQLLSEPGVKATPWLMWMAEDGEPRVRRAAVERLARLGDPEVLRRVRLLLGREVDAEVRGAMQRVLISGGANPQEIR